MVLHLGVKDMFTTLDIVTAPRIYGQMLPDSHLSFNIPSTLSINIPICRSLITSLELDTACSDITDLHMRCFNTLPFLFFTYSSHSLLATSSVYHLYSRSLPTYTNSGSNY